MITGIDVSILLLIFNRSWSLKKLTLFQIMVLVAVGEESFALLEPYC